MTFPPAFAIRAAINWNLKRKQIAERHNRCADAARHQANADQLEALLAGA